MTKQSKDRPRLLIEEWLPIAALGEESVRERRSMTTLPPTYYLHVWWARRPVGSEPGRRPGQPIAGTADRQEFLQVIGIHGDPAKTRAKIDEAKRTGEDLGPDVYGYKRAFTYSPHPDETDWLLQECERMGLGDPTVLDPTAGGGSIPFETIRLGLNAIANDLNAVAWLVLKATVELPQKHGAALVSRYKTLASRFIKLAEPHLASLFPREPEGIRVEGYLGPGPLSAHTVAD